MTDRPVPRPETLCRTSDGKQIAVVVFAEAENWKLVRVVATGATWLLRLSGDDNDKPVLH
jgi:hypothetical protein